ncbi:MAG: YdbL family protein [Verrucomicrobiota bacterium]
MTSRFSLLALFVSSIVLTAPVPLRAQDLGAIRARMEQRLDVLNAAKNKGVAGENNRGYLEARGSPSPGDQQVIQAENADRRQVYAAIASETGSSADEVGRQRAAQLAELARPGHWVQGADGSWRRK